MSVFIAITALLTVLVIAWFVRPLLRPAPSAGVDSLGLNAAIYRDQLQALERDLAKGTLSSADYETTVDELQLRLLDDTEAPQHGPRDHSASVWTPARTAFLIALSLPVGAVAMYWWLGTPAALDPIAARTAQNDQITQMVDGLAARLKANPDNPQGWAMLARSYKVMGRMQESAQAFANAADSVKADPDLLVEYADVLAVLADNNMEGKPLALVKQALVLNPQHPMGLMMSGVAAYRRADFAGAVRQWEKLLTVLEPGSPDAQQVASDIARARSQAGMPPAPTGQAPLANATAAQAVTPEKINQMVERLADRLKTNPDDLAGWARLARAYKVQGRLAEAEQAYGKTGTLLTSDPDLLTQYADVLAMRAGNNLEGRPLALVNQALALNPKHANALMMAGSAAYQRADYVQAIRHWENVLTVLTPGSPDATQVANEIAEARAKAGLRAPKP